MPLERDIQSWLCRELKKLDGVWFMNTTSSGMQRRSIPDILGCRKGLAFAVELKTKTGRLKALQRKELEEFAAAGGLALVAWGKEGAQAALDAIQGDVKERERCLEKVRKPSSRN